VFVSPWVWYRSGLKMTEAPPSHRFPCIVHPKTCCAFLKVTMHNNKRSWNDCTAIVLNIYLSKNNLIIDICHLFKPVKYHIVMHYDNWYIILLNYVHNFKSLIFRFMLLFLNVFVCRNFVKDHMVFYNEMIQLKGAKRRLRAIYALVRTIRQMLAFLRLFHNELFN